MDYGFEGKVALVTGTASDIGIGKAVALTLAREGCTIVSVDFNLEGAKQTAEEVKALGKRAIALKADVANKNEVTEAVKSAIQEFGKIDILVNNAGGAAGGGPFLTQPEDRWEKDIAVNLYGTMNFIKAVLPGMIDRKYGKIVNVASVSGRIGLPISYAAAKGAVVNITRGLATDYGPSGINVNAIAPGMVPTRFYGGGKGASQEQIDRSAGRVPLRRVQTAQDMANTIAFLASDVSRNITGQTFQVDGGLVMP